MVIGVLILVIALALGLSLFSERLERETRDPESDAEALAEADRRITKIERDAEADAKRET
jgi:hypothetical protein